MLGIECPSGSYVGASAAETEVRAGDTLILYGAGDPAREIQTRAGGAGGEAAHAEAVVAHERRHASESTLAGRSV